MSLASAGLEGLAAQAFGSTDSSSPSADRQPRRRSIAHSSTSSPKTTAATGARRSSLPPSNGNGSAQASPTLLLARRRLQQSNSVTGTLGSPDGSVTSIDMLPLSKTAARLRYDPPPPRRSEQGSGGGGGGGGGGDGHDGDVDSDDDDRPSGAASAASSSRPTTYSLGSGLHEERDAADTQDDAAALAAQSAEKQRQRRKARAKWQAAMRQAIVSQPASTREPLSSPRRPSTASASRGPGPLSLPPAAHSPSPPPTTGSSLGSPSVPPHPHRTSRPEVLLQATRAQLDAHDHADNVGPANPWEKIRSHPTLRRRRSLNHFSDLALYTHDSLHRNSSNRFNISSTLNGPLNGAHETSAKRNGRHRRRGGRGPRPAPPWNSSVAPLHRHHPRTSTLQSSDEETYTNVFPKRSGGRGRGDGTGQGGGGDISLLTPPPPSLITLRRDKLAKRVYSAPPYKPKTFRPGDSMLGPRVSPLN